MPRPDPWPTISELASSDLDDIFPESLLNWGPIQAERYRQRLTDALQSLAANPEMSRTDDRLPPGFRVHFVRPYAICYEIADADVIIHRIVHQRRELGELFEDFG